MLKTHMIFILLLAVISGFGQTRTEKEIVRLLQVQTEAWNRGDIESFMQTYWKSDSLLFIGKSGVRRGWRATLENYKKSYPDTAAMGKLTFNVLEVKPISPEYYYVVGKWMLARSMGDLSGHFDLLIRKIRGKWLIVADHSS